MIKAEPVAGSALTLYGGFYALRTSGVKSFMHLSDHRPVSVDAVAVHFPDDQAAQLVFVDVGQLGCQGISAVIGNEIEVIVGFGIVVPQIRRFLFLIIALMPSGSSLFNSGLLNGDQVMPGEIVDRVRGGADNC